MLLLRGRQERADAKVGRSPTSSASAGSGSSVSSTSTAASRLALVREVVMMVLLLLQQERMESHLGLREQLIDLLSLFETHLEREAMQRAAVRSSGAVRS